MTGRSLSAASRTDPNESLELVEDGDNIRFFILTLKPQKLYKFELNFTPQNTKPYEFRLPLTLGNNTDFNPDLQKMVFVEPVPPKIILEPIDGLRDFGKKIITHTEHDMPDKLQLTISNPDSSKSLNFFIKCDELEADRVFVISKSEGSIPPNKSLNIDIEFKPHVPGEWEFNLPIYLDRDRENKKSEIVLKGVAAFPKVQFDRRQIIMPIVPLDTESRCFFRIINEGF